MGRNWRKRSGLRAISVGRERKTEVSQKLSEGTSMLPEKSHPWAFHSTRFTVISYKC